ncbi:MAG: hypothetical protein VX589_14005 [Myxococcota bacterium]|nr:hypothetical protein [Myxococcota bacterium]
MYRGSGRVDNTLGEDTTIQTLTASASFGIWGPLSASVSVPVIRSEYRILRHQTADGMPLPYFEEIRQGLGDSTILVDTALSNSTQTGVDAWLSIGVSVPTGEERDYPPLRGRDFGEVLTIGTGTWDPIVVHGVSVPDGSRRYFGGVLGRVTPYENRFGSQAGSLVQTWLGARQAVGETGVAAQLRLGYRHQWRARRDGNDILNSGGDWVSVMPVLEWAISEVVTIKGAVDIPVWRNLYSASDEIDQPVNGQSDADFRWLFSLVYEGGK